MKQDKLEKYITDHSKDFDDLEPRDALWDTISTRIKPDRRFYKWRVAMQAAAAIAIFIGSWVIHDLVQNHEEANLVRNEVQEGGKVQVLMEAEVFYTAKINMAREEVYKLSGNNDTMMDILNLDLEELEDVFNALKNDLKDESGNQEVVEAMIQNYRLKLQILEEMLLQLKKTSNPVQKNNGYEI